MISETSPVGRMKVDNLTEPVIRNIYGKKIINPIKRYKVELKEHGLGLYRVKRVGARMLKVNFDNIWSYPPTLNALDRVLRPGKMIRKLEIECKKKCDLTDRDKTLLSEGLRRLSCLQSLSLNLGEYQGNIDSPDLYPLCYGFKDLVRLKNMNLNFRFLNELSSPILRKFGQVSRRLASLKKVCLEFDKYNLANDAAIRLQKLEAFKRLAKLESMDLDFSDCWIKDEGFQKLSQGLESLTSLRNLNLNFRNCPIGDVELQRFGGVLQRLLQLENIKLKIGGYFARDKIGACGGQALGVTLQRLTNLRIIDLDLSACHKDWSTGLEDISLGLEGKSSLQTFKLKLDKCICKFENLSRVFKTLTSLKILSFDFESIDGDTFRSFSQTYQELISLETLEINIPWIKTEDVEFHDEFSRSLEKLVSLRRIAIYLGIYFTEDTFQALVQALKNLVLLKSIDLKGSSCDSLTDANFHELGQALQALTSLESINIDFTSCVRVTEAGKKSFFEALKSLKCLKKKEIHIR